MAVALRRKRTSSRSHVGLRRSRTFGYLLLAPAVLYIVGLVAFPFCLALYYSVSNVSVDDLTGHFIGLANFTDLLRDQIFLQSLQNTFVYTLVSAVCTSFLGTLLAFILLSNFKGKRLIRFFIILPWTIPVALTLVSWRWMFDSQYSVINWILLHLHILKGPFGIQWLGQPSTAMPSVIAVNVWRNFPFGAIILLAGLTSIPPDIIDAARIDGAGFWRRYRSVMVPMMVPILFIGLLFNLVFTFTDLTIVTILTQGGPANATQVLASYAFQIGITSGDLSHGAATTLFLFPVLLVFSIIFLRQLRKKDI
ncbi:MAG: carbohydrate ABC transporter permease [Dehalococcoidia bacterium]